MNEEENAELMHNLIMSLEENDAEKALSYCTDDVTFVCPFGTFSGKEQVGYYFNWMFNTMQNIKFNKSGVGFLAKDDKGVDEHMVTGIHDGVPVEFLAICTYQFSNGKIKEMRDAFDCLTIVNQAAKGWLPKKIVGTIVGKGRKGLD